jgi:hypothetical protein
LTYYLLGIISGSIVSAILVAYINKSAAMAKNSKRKTKKGPSSGSPLTFLDEEKSA